jgi:hypothetical protein
MAHRVRPPTRPVLAILFLLALPAPPVRGQLLRYDGQAGETRAYARTQVDRVTQTVNGTDQTVDLASYWRFSTTVRESGADSVTLSVVHDSIAITGVSADSGPDFSALYGKPVTVVMGRRGEVRSVRPPGDVTGIERLDLETTYRTFFPTLPRDSVGPGTTWADTLVLDTSQNGLVIRVRRINRYRVPADAPPDGRLEVDYSTTLSLEGEGRQQGADVSLTGTGNGEGSFRFDAGTVEYLGSRKTSDVRMDAFVSAGGQNLLIPIVHRRTETIELLE